VSPVFRTIIILTFLFASPSWGLSLDDVVERDGYIYKKFSQERFTGKLDEGAQQGEVINGELVGEWVIFNEDGQLFVKGQYEKNKETGTWEIYNDEGEVIETGEYSEGFRVGLWKGYYEGRLSSKSIHENGTENYTRFHKNGEVWEKYISDENGWQGEYLVFWDNGQIHSKSIYKDNKQNGVKSEFHKDGALRFKGDFVAGEENGMHIRYFKDGSVENQGVWDNGKKIGEHLEFYENGQLGKKIMYLNDEETSAEYYDERGKKISSSTYHLAKINRISAMINAMHDK
jgi:antitoxin component YwqK of YwqJK toxin-antitoxin module